MKETKEVITYTIPEENLIAWLESSAHGVRVTPHDELSPHETLSIGHVLRGRFVSADDRGNGNIKITVERETR